MLPGALYCNTLTVQCLFGGVALIKVRYRTARWKVENNICGCLAEHAIRIVVKPFFPSCSFRSSTILTLHRPFTPSLFRAHPQTIGRLTGSQLSWVQNFRRARLTNYAPQCQSGAEEPRLAALQGNVKSYARFWWMDRWAGECHHYQQSCNCLYHSHKKNWNGLLLLRYSEGIRGENKKALPWRRPLT